MELERGHETLITVEIAIKRLKNLLDTIVDPKWNVTETCLP